MEAIPGFRFVANCAVLAVEVGTGWSVDVGVPACLGIGYEDCKSGAGSTMESLGLAVRRTGEETGDAEGDFPAS